MVKKNIVSHNLEKTPLCKFIICENLSEKEICFIESLTNLYGYKLVLFTEIKNINPLNKELVYLKELNLNLIDELLDWCIEISIIGQLTLDQKIAIQDTGVIRFWDTEKFPLEEFPLYHENNNFIESKVNVTFLGSDTNFKRKLNSLLKDYKINFFATNNPVEFFFDAQYNECSFIIVDWDLSELLLQNISNELKKIKKENGNIPIIFGLKDFQKDILFSELSLIKTFCPLLFSKEEFLSLMINSLPFTNPMNNYTEDSNAFDWNFSKEGKLLIAPVVKKVNRLFDFSSLRQKKLYEWNMIKRPVL